VWHDGFVSEARAPDIGGARHWHSPETLSSEWFSGRLRVLVSSPDSPCSVAMIPTALVQQCRESAGGGLIQVNGNSMAPLGRTSKGLCSMTPLAK
jgi:hypothetical protein